MKVFNIIFVIGIALFLILSVSTILADSDANADYPKILPGDLPFVNHTSSEVCFSEAICGWIFYRTKDEGVVPSFARIECLCPQNEQCEHTEDNPTLSYIQDHHYYKCTK